MSVTFDNWMAAEAYRTLPRYNAYFGLVESLDETLKWRSNNLAAALYSLRIDLTRCPRCA